MSSGQWIDDKATWWWNEEAQERIQRKRLVKKKWDSEKREEVRQECKEMQSEVKREEEKAKQKAYDEMHESLDTKEGEKNLCHLATVREFKDGDGNVRRVC